MTTVVVPKKITKGENLVVIPKKDYEALLNKTILDSDLTKVLKEVAQNINLHLIDDRQSGVDMHSLLISTSLYFRVLPITIPLAQ